MSRRLIVPFGKVQLTFEPERPPWGWRFWTFAGFPEDPVEPRPYGMSRGIPLAMIRWEGRDRWATAQELDGSLQLWSEHELFQCEDQEGAEAFAEAWIAARLAQPELPL